MFYWTEQYCYFVAGETKKLKDYKNVVESDLLTGLLNKKYFTELAYDKNFNSYDHYNLAVPMAIPPKMNFNNPCKI